MILRELQSKLVETWGDLCEGTTNRKWGIGRSMAAWLASKHLVIEAENISGELLQRLREEYQERQ